MINTKFFAFLMILSLLAGCGGGGSDSDSSLNLDDSAACQAIRGADQNGTGLRIIDGESCELEQTETAVVRLNLTFADSGSESSGGICSGVLIAPDTVLTAAHCFLVRPVAAITVDAGTDLISATELILHPRASLSEDSEAEFDAALIKLSRSVSAAPIPVLLSRDPKADDVIFVYGYGAVRGPGQGLSSSQTLRAGAARVDRVTDEHIISEFNGNGANPCFGDSGGPAILSDTGDPLNSATAGVVGVTSTGLAGTNCLEGDITFFTKLSNPEILEFLTSNVLNATFN